ncbi:uncharacterized protein EV420DRAFT_1645281 [Desarmillaria tabescens]|uniref:DUF6534 domain-containing protein n=1 Tax=Armillaria tabescens TaxID=1929756 RepID=A0AA39K8A2_ARMTA|nr:uncharacterized protein EV420DRAFT_1645281 [Desarmillaria tabescens]KAK0454048.1 hypothetical protein EV420DRAFT_1645281 [Desarmillaria tabescens]
MPCCELEVPFNVTSAAGFLLLGLIFNWGLFGICIVQIYIYYLSFPNDKWRLKLLVYSLFIVETAQTLLVTHDMYNIFATEFGNIRNLGQIHIFWITTAIATGLVSSAVQIYFAHRICIFSGSNLIGYTLSIIALIQGSAAIVEGVFFHISTANFAEVQSDRKTHIIAIIWLAGSAICDVLIALSMTYYEKLSRAKENTVFRQTRARLNKVIRLTVETGATTAVFATADMVLYLGFPGTEYCAVPALILAKLYTNTLLYTLNNRRCGAFGGQDELSSREGTWTLQFWNRMLQTSQVGSRDPIEGIPTI